MIVLLYLVLKFVSFPRTTRCIVSVNRTYMLYSRFSNSKDIVLYLTTNVTNGIRLAFYDHLIHSTDQAISCSYSSKRGFLIIDKSSELSVYICGLWRGCAAECESVCPPEHAARRPTGFSLRRGLVRQWRISVGKRSHGTSHFIYKLYYPKSILSHF